MGVRQINQGLIAGPLGLGTPKQALTGAAANASASVTPSLVDIVAPGNELPRGKATSTDTKFFALTVFLARSIPIYVEAKFSGGTSRAPQGLRWSGGEPSPDHDDSERLILTKDPGKFVVSCSLGRVTKTAVIYVVGAQQTDFRGDGGGVFHSDNLGSLKRKDGKTFPTKGRRTGRNMPPLGSTFDFNDFCETQYTIQPNDFVADANAGRFLKDNIKWLITREKQTQLFVGDTSGNWVNPVHDVAFVDDTDEDNQMVDPWSTNGHLYSNDGPGFFNLKGLTLVTEVVWKNRFQERVMVTFDGTSPKTGNTCSDTFQWHDFRSLTKGTVMWQESGSFGGNELVKGDKDWGLLPAP
jgi:hypothetical protein